jgi:hypothetical protein
MVIRNILAEVHEDDLGLYEVVWDLRTSLMPDADDSEVISTARELVEMFLDRGIVRLVRWKPLVPPEVAATPIPESEITETLASDRSWHPPRAWEEGCPALDITEAGKTVWELRPS